MTKVPAPQSETAYVATRLNGGLGNQLFQYAAGRALASRLNARLIFDCTLFAQEPIRVFELGRYPIDAELAHDGPRKIPRWKIRLPGRLGRRVAEAIQSRIPQHARIGGRRFPVFMQKTLDYDPRFERLSAPVCLSGHWQSYRYFERIAEIVRRELRPLAEPAGANRTWLDRIRQANSVCVHVRRADYASRGISLRPDYYDRAVQAIVARVQSPQFFVFSDDRKWCRETLRLEGAALVDANGPEAVVEDLRLMAACRHQIIANSSLSWWAAWLASRPEQVVVAPQPWFAHWPATPDLLPKAWIALSTT